MVRINGTMQPLNMDPLKQEDIESILPQILDEDQLQSFEKNKEIDFSASLEGKGRFRVNFFNQIKGMAGVFRTIPEVVKDFDDLGIPPVLRSLALLDRGLVLLTGPTGSGKSTTLAAMVDHINTQRKCHIITIEDPVEYYHETKESLINQRELGANTHSFRKCYEVCFERRSRCDTCRGNERLGNYFSCFDSCRNWASSIINPPHIKCCENNR